MGILIKMNDLLYNASLDTYNTETKMYNNIGDISSNIDELLESSTFKVEDLNNTVTIEEDIFKPIDKFDNFSIINNSNDKVFVKAIKSNKELVVSKSLVKQDVVNLLNFIELDTIGDIKLVFSINGGEEWLTYNNDEIRPIVGTIPNKDYSELNENELTQWNDMINIINIHGISSSILRQINWNDIVIIDLRIALVFNKLNYNDINVINSMTINFDSKGHLKKMKKSEYDVLLYDYALYIKSLVVNPIIKINASLSENLRTEFIDNRIKLSTPVMVMEQDGNSITLNWEAIYNADYYKVYLNGICIDSTSELSSIFTIENSTGNYVILIRAYSNDITKYKPSDYSNSESIDYFGYLATKDNEYVGIRLNGKLYRYKVKNSYVN